MTDKSHHLFLPLRDGAGCSSKIPPSIVHDLLCHASLHAPHGSVATSAQDDAAAIPQEDGSWLILTTDNSMLTGETAFQCGMISALNAMSDVWAMGGEPQFLAGTLIRSPQLREQDIVDLLRGADAAVTAAGAFYVTGQMNQMLSDAPSWLGFTAVGRVKKSQPLMLKRNLRDGQVLILTKPIGTGLLLMAFQDELCSRHEIEAVLASMCSSNQIAARVLSDFGVDACTDVSGSGLGGSLAEMASASNLSIEVDFDRVPLFPGIFKIAQRRGSQPALNIGNRDWAKALSNWIFADIDNQSTISAVLFDPQTSGGLLAGVNPTQAGAVVEQLSAAGVPAVIIGRVVTGQNRTITVLKG